MTFVLIAPGVAVLMAVAKDKARRFPEPQKYRDEEWCYSPFSNTEYTDGRTEIVHRSVQKTSV